MSAPWKTGSPRELIADLRVGGWLQGHSALFPAFLRLHKTDLISDVQKMSPDSKVIWKIAGDPTATGRYAKSRRTVVIWLGK